MKKQNKQVWYVLAAAMLAASLNACANNDASEEIATTNQLSVIQTEAVTVSEEQMYIDALPGADFDGEVFLSWQMLQPMEQSVMIQKRKLAKHLTISSMHETVQ